MPLAHSELKLAASRPMHIVPEDNGAKNQIEAILNGTAGSIDKLTTVVAAADATLPMLPSEGRTFFNDNLRVQARFLLDLNRALRSTADAMKLMPDRRQAAAELKNAAQFVAAMRDDLHEAEHDRFVGWYDGERLLGVSRLQQRIEDALRAVTSQASPASPTAQYH